jgi:multiple sugar transport system substrate-binding protein
VDPNTDDKAFVDGRVALSWVGHWQYNPYAEALGDELVVLPLPDFGAGTKSGLGSWAWGVGASSKNGAAAGKFLDYLLNDKNVAAMTDANAAPPGTTSVTATSALYKPGGPLELFSEQLAKTCGTNPPTPSCVATSRPITPAYPVISQQFSQAFLNAYKGADAQAELDKAAKAIDQDYEDNNGYSTN